MKELSELPKETYEKFVHFAYQVDENIMIGPEIVDIENGTIASKDDASNYMNHSCEPNCWFEGDLFMTAIRDIFPGEEVCFDYATCDATDTKNIQNCICGSPKCRVTIKGDDWKRKELQEAYKGHFLPWFNLRIEKQSLQ